MEIETRRALKKTLLAMVLGLMLIVVTTPIHEFGHWIVARIDGAQIHYIVWFPHFNGTHFINAEITVNELSFSSIYSLTFCKLAGFLILFVPSFLFFIYFFRRGNEWWNTVYIVMMGSIISANHDFLGIGRTLNSIHLALGLYIISYIVTFGICVPWYGLKQGRSLGRILLKLLKKKKEAQDKM